MDAAQEDMASATLFSVAARPSERWLRGSRATAGQELARTLLLAEIWAVPYCLSWVGFPQKLGKGTQSRRQPAMPPDWEARRKRNVWF